MKCPTDHKPQTADTGGFSRPAFVCVQRHRHPASPPAPVAQKHGAGASCHLGAPCPRWCSSPRPHGPSARPSCSAQRPTPPGISFAAGQDCGFWSAARCSRSIRSGPTPPLAQIFVMMAAVPYLEGVTRGNCTVGQLCPQVCHIELTDRQCQYPRAGKPLRPAYRRPSRIMKMAAGHRPASRPRLTTIGIGPGHRTAETRLPPPCPSRKGPACFSRNFLRRGHVWSMT